MRSLHTEANHLGFTKPSSCCYFMMQLGYLNLIIFLKQRSVNRNSNGNSIGLVYLWIQM